MRIMALDYGDRRIGVAMSDPMGIIAQGYDVISSRGEENDINAICEIVKKEHVEEIVLGLPYNMNGSEGFRAEKTRAFAEALGSKTDVPIKFLDERLTTREAEQVLIMHGTRRENRKKVIDKMAATIILQTYLSMK